MKTQFHPSAAFLAAFALVGALMVPVFAAPSQSPPLGNLVDATFSSITANSGVMGGISIGTNGAISNSGALNAGMVQIFDPNGFALASDSLSLNSFQISAAGNLSNASTLHSGNVQVADTQGLSVADDAGTAGLVLKPDGSIANNGSSLPNSGDVAVSDNLNVSGHVKASNGFGKTVKRAGSVSSSMAAGASASSIATCTAGEILMSCGYSSTSGDINVYTLNMNGDTVTSPTNCTAIGKNVGSIAGTVTGYAVCWNGNN